MNLKITTWNVNSIRTRLDGIERLTRMLAPDVLCLQETKVDDEAFPLSAVRDLGYDHVFVHGMKKIGRAHV